MVTAKLLRASMTAGALSLSSGLGCAELLDVPDDPYVAPSGPWRCLNQAVADSSAAAAEAHVRVRTCDFITDCTTNVTGLTAKLCDKRDVGCNQPRLSNITDQDGEFRFQVPTAGGGFDGYLRVDSGLAFCTDTAAFGAVAGATLCGITSPTCDLTMPDERCYITMFAPAMMFFNPPIVHDVERPLPLQMFPSAGLPAVISAAGIQIDPAGGSLFIQALDCDGRPAAGVRYQVAQHASVVRPLYVDNGLVSSVAMQTDSTGVGGFVSVPPGFVTVTGYTSDGVTIGELGLQAAPSTLTYGTLAPAR